MKAIFLQYRRQEFRHRQQIVVPRVPHAFLQYRLRGVFHQKRELYQAAFGFLLSRLVHECRQSGVLKPRESVSLQKVELPSQRCRGRPRAAL